MTAGECRQCGTANPAEARFCMSCGATLANACPSCGTEAPPGSKFCMSCGTALVAGVTPAAAQATPPATPTPAESPPEERRQVTVLFADLSGYTAVAERMDPEAVKSMIDGSLRRLGDEVTRYGGTVDKYIGDNVMALFGAPVAHEDDPERAVRAGLAMQAAMSEINAQAAMPDVNFALRVGINTGEVVAGAMGGGYTVIGDTVNVAARLQSAARPATVTVGERTFRATRGVVEYTELEPLVLKGKAEPVAAWEASGLVAARPTGRSSAPAESPFIGRDEEFDLLESLYGRAVREGRPHLVTVIGEAGVGKSRLLAELEQRLVEHESPPTVRQGRCLPYGSGIAYWALGEVIKAECGIVDTDTPETVWEKLKQAAAILTSEAGAGARVDQSESVERRAALIGRLLGVETPMDIPESESEDPQRMRDSFFSAVRAGFEGMTRRGPLIVAFEDIHWADHGMLDLIEYLAQWVGGPLILLCLAREELLERRPGWGGGRRAATSIFLEPLADSETRALVEALLPAGSPRTDLVPQVVERAGGNPFFAEEMARRLAEEGSHEAATLPDSVHSLLAARLDSLEPFERRLMQQASVVGRTFWEGSLRQIAAEEGADLERALTSLQEKDLVVPGSGGQLAGEPEFAFKHVLIRDVAYTTLPKSVRARKHFEVGAFIEDRAGDRSDEVVALLAEHYSRAAGLGEESGVEQAELQKMYAKALHYLEAAGDAAASLYSNPEAFAHYDTARRMPGQDQQAISRIGEKLGDVALRMGRVEPAIEVWEECLEYHRRQEDLDRVGDLHRKIGAGLWHKGERKQAIDHYQKGINLLKDGRPCLELVRLYEEAASLYMHTGDNMLAIYASEKALRLAERLGETRAASRAHGIFGRVFGRIGDSTKARDNLERSVELARGSDQGETIRALLTLGYHLEVSDADYAGAQAAYEEALGLAEQVGDLPSQVELHTALALLATYRADWPAVEYATERGGELAEREGLVGKLCGVYCMRALLAWRNGDWDPAEQHYRQGHELAEQVGWSEMAYSSLFGLAMTLRDRGDHGGAATALAQALDVCERAGLIAQSIQAMSARAVMLSLAGKDQQAREAAEEAGHLAERLNYPVGSAAAIEARGATCEEGPAGALLLREARAAWLELGRPLDAARCELLAGMVLREADPAGAREGLERAAAEFEEHGVAHMSRHARELATA